MPETDGGLAVEAEKLTKRFGDFAAVDGIDLTVGRGETFAILGPNGAGKSSTMKMVTTVSPASAGRLRILGRDPGTDGREIRRRLGVVPQEDILDKEMDVRENLMIFGRYFNLSWNQARAKADELLRFIQLTERSDDRVEELSGGMRRRLSIARALVNEPELVLLDEPTTGLDPQARHLLWERLYQLKESGVTLLLTTHYMDEAEQLADRLVVMDGGSIVAEGAPLDLIATHCTKEVLELRFAAATDGDGLGDAAESIGLRSERLPDRSLVYADDADAALESLRDRGVHPQGSYSRRSTLEDVFLTLTGRSLVE